MTLRTIRVELARNAGHPDGDQQCGYEITVPLDRLGRIDAGSFRRHREACRVRRFWRGEPDRLAELQHAGDDWAFSYAPGETDDEPLFRLDTHRLLVGGYVTVREQDGSSLTFRITAVS